jgi:MFS family permease
MRGRLAGWWPALLLGLATIGAYGTAYYSIGVLIPVIGAAEGWGTGALAGGFSIGMLGQGVIALLCGRVFDRRGSKVVLLPSICIGSALLLASSFAQASWQFVLAWSAGAAVIGGGLYYNVTMPMTTRLYAERRAAAFSVLTLLGALASPVFYPLAACLVDLLGWRGALQALVAAMAVCVAPAALLVHAPAATQSGEGAPKTRLAEALLEPAVHRALLVFAMAAFANSALLLHQVSALEAAGMSLSAASGFAGARGAFQIPGRLFLTPLTRRFGVRGSIMMCYALAATASLALLLAVAGAPPALLAIYFTAVSGMSLGMLSPLGGLFQAEVYGDERLGTLTGVGVMVVSVAGALGAWASGLAAGASGSYVVPLTVTTLLQVATIVTLRWQQGAQPTAATATGIAPVLTPARANLHD